MPTLDCEVSGVLPVVRPGGEGDRGEPQAVERIYAVGNMDNDSRAIAMRFDAAKMGLGGGMRDGGGWTECGCLQAMLTRVAGATIGSIKVRPFGA